MNGLYYKATSKHLLSLYDRPLRQAHKKQPAFQLEKPSDQVVN
jgi:hypothetical protein